MLGGGRGFGILDRLDVRLVALLGVALAPVGIIAMVQTYRVIEEANSQFDAAIVSSTRAAAAMERESLLRGRAAAAAGAIFAPPLLNDPLDCNAQMVRLVASDPMLQFAGVVGLDGIVLCGSDGYGTDVSQGAAYREYVAERGSITAATRGLISGASVVIMTEPIVQDGQDIGYFAVSVPQSPPDIVGTEIGGVRPLEIITFDEDGLVLTAQSATVETDITPRLPRGRTLADLTAPEAYSFRAPNEAGQERVYAIAPLIEEELFTMSIWLPGDIGTRGLPALSAIVFPLLMWLVSIGVAYFAVHRLVTRHIRDLRRRIRAFTATRHITVPNPSRDTPAELREVILAFHTMTDQIMRDEADLENSLHEKDVLLREVHHRVKNNLQLIASMTNMQLRKTEVPETRFVLRRLQDRVLGLATIHRNLYEASVLTRIDSARLMSDLSRQILRAGSADEAGIHIEMAFDTVGLYPDQAVPLSLLLTETLTNALKYIGRPADGKPWLSVRLDRLDDGEVTLRVANSTGEHLNDQQGLGAAGLGSQLIDAFVLQLSAQIERNIDDGRFEVVVRFRPSDFEND
ncbi:periplasmic sensor signal transduction histidine kinase [Oceaniovalibus guishaninsula JLT2003]|uniref:histidine kinase n=1 Tax=Oceaniovalibus guishaninsula JLT2003 TaxID=1231392 RepID=K2HNV2_9RHOB|nr:sensor histidine kinase [Oceaniovalibus guishaninsula]EKE44539.1 periplasmic sensor signal transduction histidine kinase [Oceaniovalibus guishaninsula JLT2003]